MTCHKDGMEDIACHHTTKISTYNYYLFYFKIIKLKFHLAGFYIVIFPSKPLLQWMWPVALSKHSGQQQNGTTLGDEF